jgi:hypothetical protein
MADSTCFLGYYISRRYIIGDILTQHFQFLGQWAKQYSIGHPSDVNVALYVNTLVVSVVLILMLVHSQLFDRILSYPRPQHDRLHYLDRCIHARCVYCYLCSLILVIANSP